MARDYSSYMSCLFREIPATGHLPGAIVAGLFIVDRNRGAAERVNVFAPLFGLTPAETRVLAALISGEGLTSAVNHLAMTEPTARTHLNPHSPDDA
jgi:hypothetical protein